MSKTDKQYMAEAVERGRYWKEVEEVLPDQEIIQQFIDTESYALEYDEQGLIYPDYHYEIKRIMATTMRNFTDLEKKYTFYYALNLKNLYEIHKKNYDHFKAAFALLLPRIYNRETCFGLEVFNPTVAFIFFNAIDESITNDKKLDNIPFSDFKLICQFARKCFSYWSLEAMIEKNEQLKKYLSNDILMDLVEKNLNDYLQSGYFHFDPALSGVLILLFSSGGMREKEVLGSINKIDLHPEAIIWLHKYYEAFQNSSENRRLFKDFIHRHYEV
jgi:hypothetical protein